jgi:hypothetical protein
MQKVRILQNFHRFVGSGEFREGVLHNGERVEIEKKEQFMVGQTPEVSDEDAESWVDKGLAELM